MIAERDILANENGEVTFRYTESKTGLIKTRTLPGEEFLWLLMQHVLPRGFRRVRDCGFLHHDAKAQLQLVQLLLQVKVPPDQQHHGRAFFAVAVASRCGWSVC